MIRRPPRSTPKPSSAASDVYKRQVQHLLGLMASTTSVIQRIRLKMRSLQSWYLSLFDPMADLLSMCLTVTPKLACQLTWWTFLPNLLVGNPFLPLQLTIQVTTNASPPEWGAHCLHHRIHGLWTNQEKTLHINHLELLAIIKTFHAFLPPTVLRDVQYS